MFNKYAILLLILLFAFDISVAQTKERNESNKLINAGINKQARSDFNGAIFDFTKAIKADSKNDLAYYYRGLSKFYLQDFPGAINDCNAAIKINSKDGNVYNVRGLSNQALGNSKGAMQDFNKAIKNTPDSYWGYFNRGILYDNMNDSKNALKDYTKSIELNIEHLESYQNRGITYFTLGEYQKAITDFSQAIYMDPGNIDLYINRGAANGKIKDYTNAVKDYEEAIKIDATNHTIYYNLGVSYSNVKKMDRACWAWNKALALGNTYAKEAIELQNCSGSSDIAANETSNTKVGVTKTVNLNSSDNTFIEKTSALEKANITENAIREYLLANNEKLNPIEGIWSANSLEVRNETEKRENPNFGRVAVIRDSTNAFRDYKMIFLEGKDYPPYTVISEFINTTYSSVYLTQLYSLDGTKDSWNFTIDKVGLLAGKKNYMENNTQIYKEIYFVKIFPRKSDIKEVVKAPSSGSGFLVSKNGIIATNAHVVSGYKNISAEFLTKNGKESYKLKILFKDDDNDIALLKIDDNAFKPVTDLPYGIEEKHSEGENVFTLGFPLAHVMGSDFKVVNGIISSKTGPGGKIKYMTISVPLQPGNSGGPLFNATGNIVGVTSARLTGGAQNVSYGLKASYLNNLIKMVDDFQYGFKKDKLEDLPLAKQINTLKYFICLINSNNK